MKRFCLWGLASCLAGGAYADADWTGFYLGLRAERVKGEAEFYFGDGILHFDLDASVPVLELSDLHDFGRFALGGDLEIGGGAYSITVGAGFDATLGRAMVRLGYDAGPLLPYVTAGRSSIERHFAGLPEGSRRDASGWAVRLGGKRPVVR